MKDKALQADSLKLYTNGSMPAMPDATLPRRTRRLALSRDSKTGRHHHNRYYPLLKFVGDSIKWCNGDGTTLPLSELTHNFGAATLSLEHGDAWNTEQPLWLTENQALFDRIDWLPKGTSATLLYYGGYIHGRLLAWLCQRRRASHIILFPDYDGVGLSLYARLHQKLGNSCEFWLMPQWEQKLARYGNARLWHKTSHLFTAVAASLPPSVRKLAEQMQRQELALEQEAVWLRTPEYLPSEA